ncbi:tetratricopeptide repeat protein [Variovorax sp. EL159]|uniref:tetratricopeptide repeat protein n=1 Tax=Variovorax sp. EL159 TaxID=1566270 RepID=UPI000884EEC4|nr:tetratricopeptide repeat protein [Variovorax sp. EL159]SCX68792.1 Tetratricopeptide repeat-containing protein [Variovorax sp. EL159]
MLQRLFAAIAFVLAISFAAPTPALAKTAPKEPGIQQIYEAAKNGRMAEANAMIAKVLKNHPNSAKAHFVHAELLAMDGKLDDAREALSLAKEIAPGLPFAKAESLAKLERKLEKPVEVKPDPVPAPSPLTAPVPASTPTPTDYFPPTGSIPWGPLGVVALVVVAYAFFRRRSRAVTFPVPAGAAGAPRFSGPMSDSSMGYATANSDGGFPPSPPPSQGPSVGGALAAGAAAGVGAVVAGELLRHLLNDRSDDHRGNTVNIFNNHGSHNHNADIGRSLWPSSDPEPDRAPDRSFVDDNFGIKDTSSWDDSSSSSSSSDSSSDSGSSDSSSSDW